MGKGQGTRKQRISLQGRGGAWRVDCFLQGAAKCGRDCGPYDGGGVCFGLLHIHTQMQTCRHTLTRTYNVCEPPAAFALPPTGTCSGPGPSLFSCWIGLDFFSSFPSFLVQIGVGILLSLFLLVFSRDQGDVGGLIMAR